MNSSRHALSALLLGGLLVPNAPAHAGSATWNLAPTNGDWNTAANWTPATVPNDPADIATFGVSNLKNPQMSVDVALDSLTFTPGGSPYNVTLDPSVSLNLWGEGVINESGQPQTLLLPNTFSTLHFRNNATAGDFLSYEITGSDSVLSFLQTSSAGSANFVIDGPFNEGDPGIYFFDDSTAADGTFTIKGNSFLTFAGSTAANAVFTTSNGGSLYFGGGNGGNCTIINEGATSRGGFTGHTTFNVSGVSAEAATITAHGGAVNGADGATVDFWNSSAGSATILVEGGPVNGAGGASLTFQRHASAGNATITLTGGMNGGKGGRIQFISGADGGTARLELLGRNTTLDISTRKAPGMAIGSIEGDGLVFLGPNNLIVGGNDLTTSFSGLVQDGGSHGGTGGSLSKVGSGSITLSGANLYTGSTSVSAGALKVANKTGSATGTGAVNVIAGTLGGKGIIAGPTTIGTGSGAGGSLQPGKGASTATTLTLHSGLTFKSDSTYVWKLNTKKAKADQVIANGVSIESGAIFDLNTVGNKKLTTGKVFTAISNTSATAIIGTFANLPDSSTFTVGPNTFQVSYSGGDGNDLTLTVVP